MSDTEHLGPLGWNDFFAGGLAPGEELLDVARVVQEHKEAYLVHSRVGEIWAEISGKMRHAGVVRADFPAVGDWVVLRGMEHVGNGGRAEGPVQIARILPRRTVLRRRVDAGHEQVLAVNVDVAFLASSLNENFNVRRIERYLMVARDAGARPVVLLTKADLCADAGPFVEEVRQVAKQVGEDVGIHAISVVTGQGVEAVREYLKPGVTAVLLGSSGIGKSTLVNYLAEADVQDMMEAREFDDKGRHCTTFRNLVRTKTGGLIIDTPGLRGLTVGEATEALGQTFADIEALAAGCKFGNCAHESEPGCAIKGALEKGTLDAGRLESYLKLQREVTAMARRENRVADRKAKKLEKKATVSADKCIKKKFEDRWGK